MSGSAATGAHLAVLVWPGCRAAVRGGGCPREQGCGAAAGLRLQGGGGDARWGCGTGQGASDPAQAAGSRVGRGAQWGRGLWRRQGVVGLPRGALNLDRCHGRRGALLAVRRDWTGKREGKCELEPRCSPSPARVTVMRNHSGLDALTLGGPWTSSPP